MLPHGTRCQMLNINGKRQNPMTNSDLHDLEYSTFHPRHPGLTGTWQTGLSIPRTLNRSISLIFEVPTLREGDNADQM